MSLLSILLQVTEPIVEMSEMAEVIVPEESYFQLILKGGWVLLPIFLLSLLAIYVTIMKWVELNRLGKSDSIWLSRIIELISEDKADRAIKICAEQGSATSQVVMAGLKNIAHDSKDIETAMEVESRQAVSKLDNQMNLLSMTASIAPMLGFIGTIIGVIRIFYDISRTNDLAIDTISTGLYEKMICSAAGLLVGMVAFVAYQLLDGRIDKIIGRMDKESNDVFAAIKASKRLKGDRL